MFVDCDLCSETSASMLAVFLSSLVLASCAFSPRAPSRMHAQFSSPLSRRDVLAAAAGAIVLGGPSPVHALIKGSAPPPKMAPKERKCKSIDECEALGEKERLAAEANVRTDFERTSGGDRYRDINVGSGKAVAQGDAVEIRYRVMRLGTKARDGLSGEGQTIFSLGFGEDDDQEGSVLPVQLRGSNLVAGVNDALVGMKPGGRRRVLVRPERGWRIQTGACAEGEKTLGLDAAQRSTAQVRQNPSAHLHQPVRLAVTIAIDFSPLIARHHAVTPPLISTCTRA